MADTDENQGSLGFEEFCSFYKMISTRRDLYLIMISYSNHKEVLDLSDLARFLEIEQKVACKGPLRMSLGVIVFSSFNGLHAEILPLIVGPNALVYFQRWWGSPESTCWRSWPILNLVLRTCSTWYWV